MEQNDIKHVEIFYNHRNSFDRNRIYTYIRTHIYITIIRVIISQEVKNLFNLYFLNIILKILENERQYFYEKILAL